MSPFRIATITALAVLPVVSHTAAAQQSTTYNVTMTGAQETPPNGTKGTGTALFTMKGNKLTFDLEVKELSGPPTAAHIHVGAPGVAGPPVFTFTLTSKNVTGHIAHGTIDLAMQASPGVSGDSLEMLLNNGNAYVNVHTAANPNGEIRGQVLKH